MGAGIPHRGLDRLLGVVARSGHCGLPVRTVIAFVGGTGLLGMVARSGHCGLPARTVIAVDGGWHPTPGFGQIVGRGGTFWPLRAASPHRDCIRWGHGVGQSARMPNNLPNPVPPTTAITVRAGSPQWPERARMGQNAQQSAQPRASNDRNHGAGWQPTVARTCQNA